MASPDQPSQPTTKPLKLLQNTAPKIVLTARMERQVREGFDMLDTDGDGLIDINAVRVAIQALGCQPEIEGIKKMIAEINKEGSETLSFGDFLNIMTLKMNEVDSEEDMREAFHLMDEDDSGKISITNLKRISERVGADFGDEELMEMIDKADRDNDGRISEEEFVRMMRKTTLN